MVCFCLGAFTITVGYSESSVRVDQVKAKIDRMLFSDDYRYEIIKVSDIVSDLCAVAIVPPYREFPNIVVFKINPDQGEFNRVYEGLCLGIQDKPSGKTDLHTLGMGADMQISEGANQFDNSSVRQMIEISNQSGMVTIPYPYFVHLHPMGTEAYTIDKTGFYGFALKLLGNVYNKYPQNSCMMYDMPNLKDFQFSLEDGKYTIIATTDNQQLWKVTFDGVDQDNRYLLNKKIAVKAI